MSVIAPIKADRDVTLRGSTPLECSVCPARKLAPCGTAAGGHCTTLQSSSMRKAYKSRQVIFRPGDNPGVLVTIVSGIVATSATLEDGRTQILSLHFRGDILGYLHDQGFAHEIIAMTNVRLCHKKRSEFLNSIDLDSGFRRKYLQKATENLEESRGWTLTIGRKNARERVATLLVVLGLRGGPSRSHTLQDNYKMTLPLSREEIANHLGLTIATISRAFTKLRKDGIIQVTAKEIIIPVFADLVAETGDGTSLVNSP